MSGRYVHVLGIEEYNRSKVAVHVFELFYTREIFVFSDISSIHTIFSTVLTDSMGNSISHTVWLLILYRTCHYVQMYKILFY